jgi:hypothetical protein
MHTRKLAEGCTRNDLRVIAKFVCGLVCRLQRGDVRVPHDDRTFV